MKTRKSIMKKVFYTIAVLMFFTAVQAHAGSVNVSGQIDYVTDNDATGITLASPVSLFLEWQNDALVDPVGESTVIFDPAFLNSMAFTLGGLTITNDPLYGDAPTAHFTDGLFDGFEMNWYSASIGGVSGVNWSIFATTGIKSLDQTGSIFFEILDEGSVSGDWFEGSLNPVPVPGAIWLFGSGLIGLVGIRRKRMG